MKKTAIFLIFILLFNLCAGTVIATEDAKISDWAVADVEKARLAGIVIGDMLNYKENITRQEFCALVVNGYRALGGTIPKLEISPFADVFNMNVEIAYTLGIVKGVSETKFLPHEKITREQMAVMMSRMVEKLGASDGADDLSGFQDAASISPWAADGVKRMVGMGIIKGISETVIAPQELTSREQAIVMLYRLYELLGGKDILIRDETTPELLVELGIISEEDWNKDGILTTWECFEILSVVGEYRPDKIDDITLREWYYGETLASLDYLEEDKKKLLLSLRYNGRNPIIEYSEIPLLNLEGEATWYEALVYVVRMVGDTYGCTDSVIQNVNIDRTELYRLAYEKGLISSADTVNADQKISRQEFYELVHKALFVEFYQGGYSGSIPTRIVDWHAKSVVPVPTEEPTQGSEYIPISVDAVIRDDLSIEWTVPEEYRSFFEECMMSVDLVREDGSIKEKIGGSYKTDLPGDYWIEWLVRDYDTPYRAIRCTYFQTGVSKRYYFDIDISDIKVVIEGEEINPGTYTRYNGQWPAKEISLAEGEMFEAGCYYRLIDYQKEYRKEEYNWTSYECFKAEETSNLYVPPKNYSIGVSNLDEIHIQKITVRGNAQEGFLLSVTPESTNVFTVVELAEKREYSF